MTVIRNVLRRLVIGSAIAWVLLFSVECRKCGKTRYAWSRCSCRHD